MRRIRFHSVRSLKEALEIRARCREESAVLAGGTDLLVALRLESASLPPLDLIDLTTIGSLRGVEWDAGTIRIGALTTHADLERSRILAEGAPLLAAAAASVGSPQIRNRGTIGGNIANAAACADTLPPLLALDARLLLSSTRGTREVDVRDFVRSPYRTILEPDEIVTGMSFRALRGDERGVFVKLGRRNALSVSRMGIACAAAFTSGGSLTNVRVAAGAVVPTVRRFPTVERCLEGTRGDPASIAAAGIALSEEMVRETGRRWSTPYKEPVVRAMLRKALAAMMEGRR
jgi:CO/xanthine dehydrogenase FAD-binding subunit